MAHVTTPRWQSPVSRRILFIVIAAAAALILLTSLLVSNATAAATVEIVEGIEGDACQELGYGIDAEEFVIPASGGRYSATFDLGDGVSVSLNSPPNRKFVDFTITNGLVNGAVLFNRVDQDQGAWYDYDPAVSGGRLEPPPRDSGNDKKVVLCFAETASLSIEATLNDIDVPAAPTPVVTNPLTWTFTVKNTGGLPLTGVNVKEGTTTICSIGSLAPAAEGSCTPADETGVIDGEVVTRTFTATGSDPEGAPVTAATTPSYLVGLECGEPTTTGGPQLTDDPYSAFWAGEPSKEDGTCAIPISISTESNETDQLVRVEPAEGFTWYGVTGLVTIQWDAEVATLDAVPRTKQVFNDDSSAIVPWCAEVVGIKLVTDEWYYQLDPVDGIYDAATAGGDTCLVLQSTTPVVGTGLVQTTEVFYIFNDPILSRPR
ncbi:MAG TPA: hypothetical protein VLA29_12105 [Acidimicrobiia bacterium]|nr:hypothetical protein [Acidimicrobiia bacterium]